MKKLVVFALAGCCLSAVAQDKKEFRVVETFSSPRAINARTTEVVETGKLDFNVTHNFGDFAGRFGGIKNFFGLDNSTDVRIGFTVGIARHLEASLARAKGASPQTQLVELGAKYQLMQQRENDPSHPLAMAVSANFVAVACKASAGINLENSFSDFSDRLSQVWQLILARRFGKFTVQLNGAYLTRGYAISYDMKNMFALGGALRLPLGNKFNLVLDYFHPFRSPSSRDSFSLKNSIHFYDPLGIGLEIKTAGHIFRLNFTNCSEILENRFIPRTIHSWSKGQYRWGFNISRKFRLWREKNN